MRLLPLPDNGISVLYGIHIMVAANPGSHPHSPNRSGCLVVEWYHQATCCCWARQCQQQIICSFVNHCLVCTLRVESWCGLQSCHLLELVQGFKRNFNPLWNILETAFANRNRHTCAAAVFFKAAAKALPAKEDTPVVEALAESQLSGTEPADASLLSVEDGQEVILSQVAADQVRGPFAHLTPDC